MTSSDDPPRRRQLSFIENLPPPDPPSPYVTPEYLPPWRTTKRPLTPDEKLQAERERLARVADERRRQEQAILAGADHRQPPELRGRVFPAADRDGYYPSPFPPYRESAGGELTDEFIAFQGYGSPSYATHPEYFCPRCTIRFNGRNGGLCGPCRSETEPTPITRKRDRQQRPEYPT